MAQMRTDGGADDEKSKRERIREMLESVEGELDCLGKGVDMVFQLGIFKMEEIPAIARDAISRMIQSVARDMESKDGLPAFIPAGRKGHRIVRIEWAATWQRAKNVLVRGKQLIGAYERAWNCRLDMITRGEEEECPPLPQFTGDYPAVKAQLDLFEVKMPESKDDDSKDTDA